MNKIFEYLNTDIDAVLITSDVNRRYFTGLKSTAGICLITQNKKFLLVDFRYYEKAVSIVKDLNVSELKNRNKQLEELFSFENIKTVAVEADTLTVAEYEKLRNDFTNIRFETKLLSEAINKVRSKKSEYEIECIIKAQRIAEEAFEKTLTEIKVGMTERQVADILEDNMKAFGSEGISFDTIVLFGENSAMPHGEPSDTVIKEGNFLLFDFGATYNGYHSDMTRTVAIGYATKRMKEIYNIVLNAQVNAIDNMKIGMTGAEIDSIARTIIKNAGYGDNFGHSLGHSVGLEIHEYPNFSPSFDKPIEKGVVMTVEPGIYLSGEFGVRIEDMVVLTENGVKNLTNSEKSLRIIK